MSKLTLNVNPSVVSRAKRYAKQSGSVGGGMPPILRSLRGTLTKADLDDCRKHLSGKHR
jgi:hypothetical protein